MLLLGIVSFFNDLSSDMIVPILPMFIAALGGTGLMVGLIGGIRDSLSSLLKVVCGYWSDKTGTRKPFVFSGYLTSSVFKLLLSFSRIWSQVLVFTGLERVGKGLRTAPRDAIIADSMPSRRGKGFGVHRAFDSLGAILGSAVAFLLFWFLGFGFRTIILIAAVLSFMSLVPLHFVREERREPQQISPRLGLKALSRPLKLFILTSSLFALANFSYMFFILKATEHFTGRLSVGGPILLYVLFNIFYAAFAIPSGTLSDRIGKKKVIILGYLLFSFTSLGFARYDSSLAFVVLFVLYGLSHALIDGNQRAYVSDLSIEQLRATALGTFHTANGLAALPASLLAGFLWQKISPEAAFACGGLLGIASVLLFLVLKPLASECPAMGEIPRKQRPGA